MRHGTATAGQDPGLEGFLTPDNAEEVRELLTDAIQVGLDFKLRNRIFLDRQDPIAIRDQVMVELEESGTSVDKLLIELRDQILPLSKNEASPYFMGFGDTGSNVGAMVGAVIAMLTQQNMINQSFDSPAATFVELTVVRWLRQLIGYPDRPAAELTDVWSVGGVMTHGGTMSNTIAMMLARERMAPGTMSSGVTDPHRFGLVVPRGINHYSIKAAMTWIGCGASVIEVETNGYRYDRTDLSRALRAHRGEIAAVVAYAGDSRTQTIDDLAAVAETVRAHDPAIWLHADACWGGLCALSDELRPRLAGIELFDSVTLDPHKILGIPYALSALLVRDPAVLRSVSTYSDLIMQEEFALGQVSPFIGSKAWESLKLWMTMRSAGRDGLSQLATSRVAAASYFADQVRGRDDLLLLNEPDLMAVVFLFAPDELRQAGPDLVNEVNREIHRRLLQDGNWYLHQFSLPDPGVLAKGQLLYPLRFMSSNPRITGQLVDDVLAKVVATGRSILTEGNIHVRTD